MKSLVVCSGGLDSVSMALIEYDKGHEVELMSFNYGQKATKELNVVKELASKYNWKHSILDISSLKAIFGKNQLTDSTLNVKNTYDKSVVVPLRNAMFLQIAYIYAVTNCFDNVILGSHLDDCEIVDGHYAFPDCSPIFFKTFETAMFNGLLPSDTHTKILSASILGYHKKDLIKRAYKIDKEMLFKTWSCYSNNEKQCGVCDSCKNRRKYFIDAEIEDETEYEVK